MFSAVARGAADEIRVRFAWGGGPSQTWSGTIAVSDGTVSEPRPLGIEADEPGSMWIEWDRQGNSELVVRQRSPRSYDGVDLQVSAPQNAKLLVRLSPSDATGRAKTLEIPLAELSAEFVTRELDDSGNRFLAMRAPGDSLRVRFDRDHLVFAPGEHFKFDIEPRGLRIPDGTEARIKVQLIGSRGDDLWSHQQDLPTDPSATIPNEVRLPTAEGVYDLVITAATTGSWTQTVRKPLSWKRTIAQRRVQVVVLRTERPAAPNNSESLSTLIEIDPANPRWYDKLNKLPQLQLGRSKLPRWLSRDGRTLAWKGELGNDCLVTRRHPLGELAELKPNADSPDVSWQAYWLPVSQPGRPHVLEVDYPNDVSQTLGLSIVEPDAAGVPAPLTIDTGIDKAVEIVGTAGSTSRWERRRVLFWPRTNTPLLLVTNGRLRQPALYGKIRVLAGWDRLPQAATDDKASHRLLAAYLDRPLIAENFAAPRSLDPWSSRCLDDWETFYQGGSRLVEYLEHAGYNGLMLGVLADGSTIYPSNLLESTPRYDTGALFASAQDPVRKDVLELLLRLFDRENLQLIPTVEFASPLPELEAIRRRGGPDAEGIDWIGPDGMPWNAASPPRRGLAPYYNLLHPQVQQAMLGVLRELVSRYAAHPAFAGVGVRLSADGYAQLLGPEWGLDDATIAHFERDTNLHLPCTGPQRFAERAALLAEPSRRQAWLQWRSAQLSEFYRRAAAELRSVRPNSRLYLVGADIIGSPDMQAEMRPSLPRRATLATTLLHAGVDVRGLQRPQSGLILLRPERIASCTDLAGQAAGLEFCQMADTDRCFHSAATPGSFFYHQSRQIRIESFEEKCPFKSGAAYLISQPSPAGQQNRQRFVRSLTAVDAQVMVDGGWALPMAEEDSAGDLIAAFRGLPAIRFETVEASPSRTSQPVTFRTAVHGGSTYLYAVNDAPMAVTARLHIEAGQQCRIEEITGRRKIAPLQPDGDSGSLWEVALEPYDLVAVRLSDPDAKCSNPRATWSESVDAELTSAIRRLGARTAALRSPPPLDLVANSGFERTAGGDGAIAEWTATDRPQTSVRLDKSEKRSGRQSVKLESAGPVTCLVSRPFNAPPTGRLAISVWLRVADRSRQPPLRLALEAKLQGRDYYRFAPVGLSPGRGQAAVPLLPEWGQYVFQVDDLPLEGLAQVRARFDLMGPGEVWVDDVQVYSLAFSRAEMIELSKLIALADVKRQQRQIGDCLRLLEGYWPRFLEANVPLPAGMTTPESVVSKRQPPEQKPPERTGWYNRVRDLLPESLRY